MGDFHVHSFDAPRERRAPSVLEGHRLSGSEYLLELTALTVVVAIKPDCDGCRDFVHGDLRELSAVDVVVVSATNGGDEWRGARRDIVVAPAFLKELDVRSAPFFVLIDPAIKRVVTEGVVFAPSQVFAEIERHLAR